MNQKSVSKDQEKAEVNASKPYRWAEQREKEAKTIRGKFMCHEPVGGSVEFVFKKFRGDAVKRYTFQHGKEYDLPVAVVKHLNENCNYPIYSERIDNNGDTLTTVGKNVQRFNFIVTPEFA